MTWLFFGSAICPFAAEISPIVIPETPPPQLNGALDDPVWQKAAKIEQLYLSLPTIATLAGAAQTGKIMIAFYETFLAQPELVDVVAGELK